MPRKFPENYLSIAEGELVYKEGDLSREFFLIHSGRVEISKESEGVRTVLARFGAGQFFGEMSLILEVPHDADAHAIEETVLRRLTLEHSERLLRLRPKAAAKTIRMLAERLRRTNIKLRIAERMIERGEPPGGRPGGRPPYFHGPVETAGSELTGPRALRLLPATGAAREALGRDELFVDRFPFKIGRRSGLVTNIFAQNDAALSERPPFQASRAHCTISWSAVTGKYYLKDRGSRLGTMVNGARVGTRFETEVAELVRGKNRVILGGTGSTLAFDLIVE